MNRSLVVAFAAVAAAGSLASAGADAGRTYRFGRESKHTNITFTSEAEVENIYGITNTAKGDVRLDFDALKGTCSISVPVKSLDTRIELRNEHLRSETWLDEKKYPDITLTSDGFELVEKNKEKGQYQAKFKGKLTIHGVTKDLETTARVQKVAPELTKMLGEGEWVRVIAGFDVTLKDFDVKIPEGPVVAKVSPTWTVKFDCYATTAEEKKKDAK